MSIAGDATDDDDDDDRLCRALVVTWQDNANLFMVLEFVSGGEMFTHLRNSNKFKSHFSLLFLFARTRYTHRTLSFSLTDRDSSFFK